MKDLLTVTTKGTVTLPAKIRQQMGINKQGDRLDWSYDAKTNRLTLEKKTVNWDDLHKRMAKYIKPGTKPLTDVDDFYQKRKPRI